MRLYYPYNDTPIFSYPMVSMRGYDWSCKSRAQKVWIYVTSWSFFIGWMYLVVVMSAHRFVTLTEFGSAAWNMLKGLLFVAIFPITFLTIAYFVRKNHPFLRKHDFYQEWATVYTGKGKRGGGVRFFFEDLAALQIQQAVYAEKPFYLVTFRFKPSLNYLGKEREVKIGLRANETEIQRLADCAKGYQVNVTLDDNQRRS